MTQLSKTLPLGAISPIHLRVPPQAIAFSMTTLLVCLSVVLFMMDSTSDQIGTLLAGQNAASLKLWSNVTYYKSRNTDASLPSTGSHGGPRRILSN